MKRFHKISSTHLCMHILRREIIFNSMSNCTYVKRLVIIDLFIITENVALISPNNLNFYIICVQFISAIAWKSTNDSRKIMYISLEANATPKRSKTRCRGNEDGWWAYLGRIQSSGWSWQRVPGAERTCRPGAASAQAPDPAPPRRIGPRTQAPLESPITQIDHQSSSLWR